MKKTVAIILAAVLTMISVFSLSAAEEEPITAPVADPSFAAEKLSLYNNPLALGSGRFTDFNLSSDYTVKSGEEMSVAFGASGYELDKIYSCDFNAGETLGIASGSGEITNTSNNIVLKGSNWLQTQNLADNIRDIDLSFDYSAEYEWTNFIVYLRGGQLLLNIRGSKAAGENNKYLVLTNKETGDEVLYDKSVKSGNIRVYAAGDSVNVFLDGNSVIGYVYPDSASPKSGNVYFTCTECEAALDNITLSGGSGVKEVYNSDFSGGETLAIAEGTGKITNTNDKIVLKGSNWLRTSNIATAALDFELSFDMTVNHVWTNSLVCMRGGQLILNICGADCAGNGKGSLVLKNTSNSDKVIYAESVSGKKIKVSAAGKTVEVYADGEKIIDYTYPDSCSPQSGAINFTATECSLTLDNLSLSVASGDNSLPFDSYLSLNIGQTVTLTEKTPSAETVIATGGTLESGVTYKFSVILHHNEIRVYADGTLILTHTIAQKYVGAYLTGRGVIGMYSSGDGSYAENVRLYNSAELEILASYAKLLPIASNVPTDFAISSQSVTDGDASVSSDSENGTFSVSSPTSLNAWAKTTGFFEYGMNNVYVRFDVRNSRNDWSYDTFYFGGYEFHFDCGGSPSSPWVSDGSNKLDCSSTYNSYGTSYYTLEFLKSAAAVTVYYYPTGGERELFFTGECITNKTNLTVKKQQGRLDFKNFELYGGCPARFEPKQGVAEGSDISVLSDGYGALPYKTTFAEFKTRMLNPDKITVYRNGRRLLDGDYVYTGSKIYYEGYSDGLNISTVADLDGNGKIDAADLYNAKRIMSSGAQDIKDTYSKSADTDFDGSVTANDVELIRKYILGDAASKCEKGGSGSAASSGKDAAKVGDTAVITVSLRDYSSSYDKNAAAVQAELCWDGESAQYVQDSLIELSGSSGFSVYSAAASGKLTVLYEPDTVDSSIAKGTNELFSFELEIPDGAHGGDLEVKFSSLTLAFSDGTALPLVLDASSEFLVLEEGVNKFTRAPSPTLASRDESTVLLNEEYGCEYSMNGIDWQNEPLFSGLSVGTVYSFYQRYAARDGIYAGDASEPLKVTLYLKGDVDRNGMLNSADLCSLRKILLGSLEGELFDSDVNGDTTTDILDLVRLKRILAERG